MEVLAGAEAGGRRAWLVTLLLATLVCGLLARIVAETAWTMDADEAVHAVEALRLRDDLAAGDPAAFLRDTWLPERWQPPVNPHVRWYPFVHAWALLPLYAVLGAGDVSARLGSVLFLFGAALVFHALARRLAPRGKVLAGPLAAGLLLTSPNVLTFSAQALAEAATLLTCLLAVLAYVRSLDAGHPPRRAVLAGLCLSAAILTKYDHGGVLAVCLGLAELLRVRFRLQVLLRDGGALYLFAAALPAALWFAHPDKLAALGDSAAHPFHGSPREILLDFVLTGFVEYGGSLAVALGGWIALVTWPRKGSDPAARAVWLWAVVGIVFYALRGRYHFRYNFVEAPLLLLLLAARLPGWADDFPERARRLGPRVLYAVAGASLALLVAAAVTRQRPELLFEGLREPFRWLHGLRGDHFGMRRGADYYVDFFREEYAAFAVYLGESAAALGQGVFLLALAALLARRFQAVRRHGAGIFLAACLVAALPSTLRVLVELPARVEWELEGHPELNDVHAFVARNAPPGTTVLLGGGWDQLGNNSLRWYRATGSSPPAPLRDVPVVGDMIGSIVFPPEPRIAWWAKVLAEAPLEELPERVVLVRPGPGFLYHERFGPEVAIYGAVLARRGSYRQVAEHHFPRIDVTVRVLAPAPERRPPLEGVDDLLARHGILPGATETSRVWMGEGGWETKDESLRHFRARRPAP